MSGLASELRAKVASALVYFLAPGFALTLAWRFLIVLSLPSCF